MAVHSHQSDAAERGAARRGSGASWLLFAIAASLPLFQFGFEGLIQEWAKPYFRFKAAVPLLSLVMFLQVLRTLPPAFEAASARWPGVLAICLALGLAVLGNLVSIDDFVFFAIVIWVVGLVVTVFGFRRALAFWAPLASLLLMLPLPRFIYAPIQAALEKLAANLGLAIARLAGSTARIEGQIIDFGAFQIRTHEAASGLVNFLPVLLIFFFFATFHRGRLWHRLMPLVLAVPVVILVAALRIAVIAVLVTRQGVPAAERFIALSGDWAFLAVAVALLLLPFGAVLLGRPGVGEARAPFASIGLGEALPRLLGLRPSSALMAGALMTFAVSAAFVLLPPRPPAEIVRDPFSLFPPEIDGWSGSASILDGKTESILNTDEYVLLDYWRPGESAPVNFWSPYYFDQEQDRGGIHSPQDCLPLAGWNILTFETVRVPLAGSGEGGLTVNRAVITNGEARSLVYYWFEGRGRSIASERVARLFVKVDGLIRNRTDGALVRFVTPILTDEPVSAADARIQLLMEPVVPTLTRFIPE